jgi:hypothetical protein
MISIGEGSYNRDLNGVMYPSRVIRLPLSSLLPGNLDLRAFPLPQCLNCSLKIFMRSYTQTIGGSLTLQPIRKG